MALSWLVQVDIAAAFSLLAAFLISIPLFWHLEAWNIGCVCYIFWMGGQCLINFINIMIWRDNAIKQAMGWCDFTTRFGIGASMGVCCASLVINRRLYHIATVSSVSLSRADKRRNMITDIAIGFGIPLVAIALYWFYQGHRFDIYEGIGCLETYPTTWLSFLLNITWPIPIGLVSGTYCILTLRAFFQRRRDFKSLMTSNNNLTFHRYFRLMGLASLDVIFTIPFAIYNIVQDLRAGPIYTYRGLADLHFGFDRVDAQAALSWRQSPVAVQIINFRLWVPVACALTFFCFFGLADEARRHYRLALSSVAKRVGITTFDRTGSSSGFTSAGSKAGSQGFGRVTIPTFVQRSAGRGRRGSLDSFVSGMLSTNISISEGDEKAPYSPVESSAGSSTDVGSPVDEEKGQVEMIPSPVLPSMAHVDFPKPPRAHDPSSPVRQDADVPSSVRHSVDMV